MEEREVNLIEIDECDSSKQQLTIKDFNNKYFWQRPKCSFSNVDIGLNNVQGKLMALGFLNNDVKPQKIDLVTVNDQMNAFRVHIFDESSHRYIQSNEVKIDGDDAYIASI